MGQRECKLKLTSISIVYLISGKTLHAYSFISYFKAEPTNPVSSLTYLLFSLASTEGSAAVEDDTVTAVIPLAVLGGGRLVITQSGVLEETVSAVFSAVESACDL